MAHKITRNITKVSDIKKLGINVTNECDLVSDGTNIYVRVGKEYRQIDNEEIQEIDMTEYYKKSEVDKKIKDSKPDLTTYYNKTQVDNLLKEITERLTALENTNESE